MSAFFRIGIIGCDTSHCSRFAALLRNGEGKGVLSGCDVVAAYPGEGEIARIEKFTSELTALGVPLMNTPEEVAAKSDAIMLLSADGSVHADLFQRIARKGQPVFIDKPLACSQSAAHEILSLSAAIEAPVFSASALRYSRPLSTLLGNINSPVGVQVSTPATWLSPEQGLYYYGIHGVEMLFAALGAEVCRVMAFSNTRYDLYAGEWSGGRYGVFRGNRTGDKRFSAQIHTEMETHSLADAIPQDEPLYIPLLEQVIPFLRMGVPPISPFEMQRVIRFIEAGAESAATGRAIEI